MYQKVEDVIVQPKVLLSQNYLQLPCHIQLGRLGSIQFNSFRFKASFFQFSTKVYRKLYILFCVSLQEFSK